MKPKRRFSLAFHVALFGATLATTWLAGAGGETLREAVINGLTYMASIMGILLAHEMGHYIMARKNKVDASLPFFLPFPLPPIGTLGAVILMRGRIKQRGALMEIGAAGPLAGVAVALPVLIYGLANSAVVPLPPRGLDNGLIMEGQSLLYMFLKQIAVGPIPEGSDVALHPMAWAGWVGLFVTTLNLLPIGQLDGGHVFYALFPNAHNRISRLFFRALFVLGVCIVSYHVYSAFQDGLEGEAFWYRSSIGAQWLFLGTVMLFFFGRNKGRGFKHPAVDDSTLSPFHKALGFACFLLFILTFAPIPLAPHV